LKAHLLSALMLALLASAGVQAQAQQKNSGVDLANIDASVRPQDDFFVNLNGKWLAKTEIPSDKSSWGSFEKLDDDTKPQLRAIIKRRPPTRTRRRARMPSASATSSPATWMKPGWRRCA